MQLIRIFVSSLFVGLLMIAGQSSANENNKTQIALVMKTLTNPFFKSMETGARKAEKEFGIELVVKTAAQETSIHQQIDIVNRLTLEKKVKAIVIAPGDSVELIPSLKRAQDEGIIIVNIDNKLDEAFAKKFGLLNVPFVSVDNEAAAYKSAKYISDQIDKPTNVAILEGIPTALNAQARKAGALRAFSENKNIKIVASQTANWKIDEAYVVTKGIFASEPDIGAVFAANDMMALGVVKYLSDAGRDDVKVAAFDAIDAARAAINQGQMDVSIDQQAGLQGYTGVQTALKMLSGEKVPEVVLVEAMVVNSSNAK